VLQGLCSDYTVLLKVRSNVETEMSAKRSVGRNLNETSSGRDGGKGRLYKSVIMEEDCDSSWRRSKTPRRNRWMAYV